jgi:long-chain acyl-CoA synthetase
LGLVHGDRLAVLSLNTYRFFALFGAAANLGLVLVPINRRLSREEITYIIEDTAPRALAADEQHRDLAGALAFGQESLRHIIHLDAPQGEGTSYDSLLLEEPPPFVRVNGDDPYMIIHTAAVEGKPRGGLLSQHNLLLASLQLAQAFGLTEKDVHLNVLPLFHIMGINLALAGFMAGGANVLQPSFQAEQAVELIVRHRVSLLGTFPPILGSILAEIERTSADAASLKRVIGLEQAETIEAFEEKTGGTFWSMYGQTETSGLITFSPNRERPGSAGRPGPMVALKAVDEFDRDVAAGEKGEIAVRGPLVFLGYWNEEASTEHVFREGWHHTGDLGRVDESGYLFFMGRKAEKELIKSGGENVFPVEVEKVILEHPAVAEVSVIGVPDATFGEGIKAVCVLRKGSSLEEQELKDFVGQRIAGYKKPRLVAFVDSLPKSEDGRIDREEVKKAYGGA